MKESQIWEAEGVKGEEGSDPRCISPEEHALSLYHNTMAVPFLVFGLNPEFQL